MALSVVREKQLSVLSYKDSGHDVVEKWEVEMWVTNEIDTEAEEQELSWSKSFAVGLNRIRVDCLYVQTSLLIDEEKKVALCCNLYLGSGSSNLNVVYIMGEDDDEYYKEIPYIEKPRFFGNRSNQQTRQNPETEKKTSSVMLDCSLLEDFVSKLQLSPSPSAKMVTKEHTLSMPDWSLLPDELLQVISEKLDNCFEVVHARSVCISWRSTIPFPSCLIRTSYSFPSFREISPKHHEDLCTLEKIPLFLFRVRTPAAAKSASEFFVGGISRRDESEDHIELPPPPLQCSVKIPGSSEPTLMKMLDCQILPLGHEYRMIGWKPNHYKSAA
ncbi:unnamed protein product [Microthlaspi erraticum]|uniref:F-box domain-containing protein n=1 Tax=Microthlaspi erraticum TaxID=1685480 RepID=A0A6D2IZE1_9BRAS|nr:unnamed protein product [Microthlaspi erraticum]